MSQSFFERRSFLIILVMMLLLGFIGMGARRTLQSNRNDVRDWLPQDFEETAQHGWFQRHFPHEAFVLVSWEGCTLDDQRLELLAQKLVPPQPKATANDLPVFRAEVILADNLKADEEELARRQAMVDDEEQGPPLFASVLTGPRLIKQLLENHPTLTEEEVIERFRGSLIGPNDETCLVVTLTEAAGGKQLRPTIEKLRRIAEECDISEDDIRLGGPPVDNVAIDIEGERTLFRLAGLSAIAGLGISWFCLRSVRLTLTVFWIALLSAAVGLALFYFTYMLPTGGACDAIFLSMPSLVYVLAISGSLHIINYWYDAIREGGHAGAADRALAAGWWPCTMAALTTALGLGSLVISHVIPISKFGLYSAFGVLATLVLLFLLLPAYLNGYEESGRRMRSLFQFLRLTGLAAYVDSRLRAHRALYQGDSDSPTPQATKDPLVARFWRAVAHRVIGHNVAVSIVCAGLLIFFIGGLTRIEFSFKLMKLFSPNAEIIHHYAWLEEHLGPLVPMEIVIVVDNQECDGDKLTFVERMRLAEKVEAAIEGMATREKNPVREVGHAMSAASFAPNIERRKTGIWVADIGAESALNAGLRDSRDEFSDLGYLALDTERLDTDDPTLEQLALPKRIAQVLAAGGIKTLDEIGRCHDLTSIEGFQTEDVALVDQAILDWKAISDPTLEQLGIAAEVIEILKSRRIRSLKSLARQHDLRAIPGLTPQQAEQVTAAVGAWRFDHGKELWRVSARVEALTDMDYSLFLPDLKAVVDPVVKDYVRQQGVSGVEVRYTGLIPLVYETQHQLMAGLVNSLASAFVLIAIVMMFVLKSVRAGALSMIPNIFPVAIVFGLMGWVGIPVDIGTMMTAGVALGVAVDDTMHYLTWFRKGLDEGRDRKGAALLAYERCATAMTQTTLVGGLGLAVFAFSTFTPTQRFGVMMLALLTTALLGDLIFLPALLTGPLGRVFDHQKKGHRTAGKKFSDGPSEELPDDAVVPMDEKLAASRSRGSAGKQSFRAS